MAKTLDHALPMPTTYQRFANTQQMPSQYTAHALPALPGQGYGPKLMFLLLSTALKDKGKKNGHTEYMANFLGLYGREGY